MLLSGGGDGAVRAWRASAGERDVLRMEQVGEFVGNGMPIVSISEVHRYSTSHNSIRFLVGDTTGAVYILKGLVLREI